MKIYVSLLMTLLFSINIVASEISKQKEKILNEWQDSTFYYKLVKGEKNFTLYKFDGNLTLKEIGLYKTYSNKKKIKEGLQRYLFTNGKDSLLEVYDNGKKLSSTTFYPNGNKKLIIDRSNKDHSKYLQYYEDGNTRRIEEYANGKLIKSILKDATGNELNFFPYFQYPEFPGGQKEMMEYFWSNIRYPQEALKKRIEGKVYVNFYINGNGQCEDVTVVRSTKKIFENEAIRVIKSMPLWKAGKIDGLPNRFKFTIPITFKL